MVLLCVVISLISYTNALSQTDVSTIKFAVEFSKEITVPMGSTGFENFLKSVVPDILKFITGTLGFINVIFSFIGNHESQELLEIKRLYATMNRRFDVLDLELNDVKRKIDWTRLKLQYSGIEMNIKSNSKLLRSIYEDPIENKESNKDYFTHSFESTCYLCAIKLYNGILGESGWG